MEGSWRCLAAPVGFVCVCVCVCVHMNTHAPPWLAVFHGEGRAALKWKEPVSVDKSGGLRELLITSC